MSNDLPEHRHLIFFGPIRPPATNGLRAALKRAINEAVGSEIVEEKSYAKYE